MRSGVLARKQHASDPGLIGTLFTVATLVYGAVSPAVGLVSERYGIKLTVTLGVLGMAIALPMLDLFRPLMATLAVLCLASAGFAFALNPTSAELGNEVDRKGVGCYACVSLLGFSGLLLLTLPLIALLDPKAETGAAPAAGADSAP